MHIAIDVLIAEKEPGGMLFATHALLEGLARIDQENEYSIITSHPQKYRELAMAPNMRLYPVKLRFAQGLLIQHQLLLPDILRRLRPDVLHVPAFAAPIGWNGPLVLTVHDLAFLQMPHQASLYAKLYWQYVLRESVGRAHAIIAISSQTRDELISAWSVKPERISVIHNALRSSLAEMDVPESETLAFRQCVGGRYLLHVGRIIPRKNVETLLVAFDVLASRFDDLHLVMAGGTGYGSSRVLQQVDMSVHRERIHLLGWVSDRNLRMLYAGANALVFPSRHEGFGLPMLEAMACGTPVVASYEIAAAEIVGEAVHRADCSSAIGLAEAIVHILADEELRKRLIHQGRARARSFCTTACAEATLQVYQNAAIPPRLEIVAQDIS